jgi:hypothetical protein
MPDRRRGVLQDEHTERRTAMEGKIILVIVLISFIVSTAIWLHIRKRDKQ